MSLKPPEARPATQVDIIRDKLDKNKDSLIWRIFKKILGAALSSIPGAGPFLQAGVEIIDGHGQVLVNDLSRLWKEEQERKLEDLKLTLSELFTKVGQLDAEIAKRLESPEFLSIVRKAFRSWDQAESQEKRNMIRLLLTNAAATKLCNDDIIKLFIEWIDKYHETHFKVLRAIYHDNESTRESIWDAIDGSDVREDSAEADLFKMLIRDLTLGGVIRQDRDVNSSGQYLKKRKPTRNRSTTMESAFEGTKTYVLTKLGGQFLHYTMKDIATRIENKPAEPIVTPPPKHPHPPEEDDAGISIGTFDDLPRSDYGPSPFE